MRGSIALLLVPAAALAVTPAVARTPRPPGGRLVFASDRSGHGDIYVVRTNGPGLRPITRSPRRESSPVWSPKGRRIAFVRRTRAGGAQLVTVDVHGRHARVVARERTGIAGLAWSPRGTRLVYAGYRERAGGGLWDLHVVGADGRGNRLLLDTPDASETGPDWSAKGQIVFTRSEPDDADGFHRQSLAVVGADGSGFRRLATFSRTGASDPAWSPDGRRVAVTLMGIAQNPARTAGDLYVLPAAGGTPRLVARRAEHASWSPDGRWLAFSESAGYPSAPAKTDALELVRASGAPGRVVLLKPRLAGHADDTDPDWHR